MKLRNVKQCYSDDVRELLRQAKITLHDFNAYGRIWYDYIENESYVILGKYNGIYDYRIGIIDGDIRE